jgi:hypothetical protein
VRVFLIIAIAHLTGNIGDIVDDHLLYGWGFFSLLTLAAMLIGNRFRQDPLPFPAPAPRRTRALSPWLATALSIAFVAVVPLAVRIADAGRQAMRPQEASALSCGGFSKALTSGAWIINQSRVDSLAQADCVEGVQHIRVAVAVLERPLRESKLLGLEHWLVGGEDWNLIERKIESIPADGALLPVLSESSERAGRRRLVWSLRWVNDAWRKPGFDSAAADFLSELAGRRHAVLLLLSVDGDDSTAVPALRGFLAQLPLRRIVAEEQGR